MGCRVVHHVAPKERDIAMVFQNDALYPHMTVRDNMAFALSLAKVPKGMIEQQVARAAQILGLAPYLNRYPRQLSGGQRQRVAMGRAIVRDPQVFLFDEPLSNLDAKLRVQMRAEIKELHQRLTTTTVYVTHDQIEAMTMADKIVVMNSGNVEQIGAPLELYDHPNNLFVAGFIGSPAMNFLQGRIEGGSFRAAGGASLPLPGKANGAPGANGSAASGAGKANASDGKPIVYGVRPEHFQLSAEGLPATVHVIEPTGSETQVMADFAGTSIICAFRERVSAKPGETIRITADPALVHLFDADSGQRMVG
jgi:multiple sugar transport system ATP-binding protein